MSASQRQIQRSQQPPAQPAYILRGHSAQIHAVHFLRRNSRLLTGDADGFVVLWSTSTKRPVAVWKPHSNTILGLGSWDNDKIITHGRDNKLCVWQLQDVGEGEFSKILPIDDASTERKAPWLLHNLAVNALNFCAFAMIPTEPEGHNNLPREGILVATPGVQDGHINVTSLPGEERIATIPAPKDVNTGMLMAIGLHFQTSGPVTALVVVAGYESGQAAVWQQQGTKRQWNLIYIYKAHAQPVLSLGIAAIEGYFYTSSADAIVARQPLDGANAAAKVMQTRHAGQQGLVVRSDEMIFATAGWDTRVRVYSVKTMKELAVLKWHKEGCYALAFSDIVTNQATTDSLRPDLSGDDTDTSVATEREVTVAERRDEVASMTHWLVAGSKDGKVSLWEIY